MMASHSHIIVGSFSYVKQALPITRFNKFFIITIRKWDNAVDCDFGCSKLCFVTLKVRVEENESKGKRTLCSLVLDVIRIKKNK